MNPSPVNLLNAETHYRRLNKLYKTLTPEEQEFVKTQQLSAGHSTAYWQKLFQRLIVVDVLGSDLRRIYRRARFWIVVAFIVSLLFLQGTSYTPVIWVLLVLSLFSSYRVKTCVNKDVDNNIRTGLVKVFQVLALETRYIKLKLDVRALDKREITAKEQDGRNTKLEFYHVPLVQLSAKLKDGKYPQRTGAGCDL